MLREPLQVQAGDRADCAVDGRCAVLCCARGHATIRVWCPSFEQCSTSSLLAVAGVRVGGGAHDDSVSSPYTSGESFKYPSAHLPTGVVSACAAPCSPTLQTLQPAVRLSSLLQFSSSLFKRCLRTPSLSLSL